MKKIKNKNIIECSECGGKAEIYNIIQAVCGILSLALICVGGFSLIIPFMWFLFPFYLIMFIANYIVFFSPYIFGIGYRIRCVECKSSFKISREEYKELKASN